MASLEAAIVAWIKTGWTVSGLEHTLLLLNTTNLGFTVFINNPRYSESLLHLKDNLNVPQRPNIGIFMMKTKLHCSTRPSVMLMVPPMHSEMG